MVVRSTYTKPIFSNMKKGIEEVPAWALNYIVNGDATELSIEETEAIDKFMRDSKIMLLSIIDDSQHFTPFPPFGLPCNVYDCNVIYYEDD